jgi:hypothetical protein
VWLLVPNCHVRIWLQLPINVFPVGNPNYDGLAQELPPRWYGDISRVGYWVRRLVVPVSPIWTPIANLLPDAGVTWSVMCMIDDATGLSYGWHVLRDVSYSTRASAVPGQANFDAIFTAWTPAEIFLNNLTQETVGIAGLASVVASNPGAGAGGVSAAAGVIAGEIEGGLGGIAGTASVIAGNLVLPAGRIVAAATMSSPPGFFQNQTNSSAAAASINVSASSGVTIGNLLVVISEMNTGGNPGWTATPSKLSGTATVGAWTLQYSNATSGIYVHTSPVTGSGTLVVKSTSSAGSPIWWISLWELSNCSTVDGVAIQVTTSTNPGPGTVTVSSGKTDIILLSVTGGGSPSFPTGVSAGYTLASQDTSSGDMIATAYGVGKTASQNPNFVFASASGYGVIGISLY